jgi:hypothetical protein
MTAPVTATIVTGANARLREQAILAQLAPGTATAVVLEGLPDGTPNLLPSPSLAVARIAPGCLCCTGNLVLRVTLNRLLRQRPTRLFIGVARGEHLDRLRSWLQAAPYDQLLELTPDLCT